MEEVAPPMSGHCDKIKWLQFHSLQIPEAEKVSNMRGMICKENMVEAETAAKND